MILFSTSLNFKQSYYFLINPYQKQLIFFLEFLILYLHTTWFFFPENDMQMSNWLNASMFAGKLFQSQIILFGNGNFPI